MSPYRISGLDAKHFSSLFGLDDVELAARGAKRCVVDEYPGFPDRIELRDLEVGERALLVNYVHHDVDTPYRSSHAIFVREGATDACHLANIVPDVMLRRTLSLRAFDAHGMMLDAKLIEGTDTDVTIELMFAHADVAYIHAHYATRGCFAARIDRDTAASSASA